MSGALPWLGSYRPLFSLFSDWPGQQPMLPVSIAASSREDVAEHVAAEEHVELLGALTSCMAALSTYMWASSTSGYCCVHLGDHVAPELEGLEHVRLVDAGHLLVALAGGLEGDMGDAFDLGGL